MAETAQRALVMEEQMCEMQAAHESALEAMRARADEEREAAVSEGRVRPRPPSQRVLTI